MITIQSLHKLQPPRISSFTNAEYSYYHTNIITEFANHKHTWTNLILMKLYANL